MSSRGFLSYVVQWSLCRMILTATPAVASSSAINFSPVAREIQPMRIYRTTGNVSDLNQTAASPQTQHVFSLNGPNASITFDFGQMVAGIPSFVLGAPSCAAATCNTTGLPAFSCGPSCEALGLAYTESSRYIGLTSDHSTLPGVNDGTVFLPLQEGPYTVPARWGRGSFQYLTLSLSASVSSTTAIAIQFEHVFYTPSPSTPSDQLQNYTGYFYSSDELLNRIWAAGAYTMQMCTIAANTSVNQSNAITGGWQQDAVATNLTAHDTYLADGAKRDRNSWSGDLLVSMKSALMMQSSNNLQEVRNSIHEILILQNRTTGYFPYAGSPLGDVLVLYGAAIGVNAYDSDTYHLYAILAYMEYVVLTNDTTFALQFWPDIVRGISATYRYIDNSTSLFNGTGTLDWGRIGAGGQSTSLNAAFYHTLVSAASFSTTMPDIVGVNASEWLSLANGVKASINALLYDDAAGLFYDNTTANGHKIYPQDGNTLAILFNVTTTAEQARIVTGNLAARLTRYGAPAPELPGSISPFITSLELRAQFLANPGNASSALTLLRTQWGYMIDTFSQTTLIEGYGAGGDLYYSFSADPSFISHAHAWSTGPVYSLINDIVGIQWVERANSMKESDGSPQWIFKPSAVGSNLSFAEGGFTWRGGEYRAGWVMTDETFAANVSVPSGTYGDLYVPDFGKALRGLAITLNGIAVDNVKSIEHYARLDRVPGGTYQLQVKLSGSH